jgi:hypothetical protein
MALFRIFAFALLLGVATNGVVLSDGILIGDGIASADDGAGFDPHGARTNAGVRIDPEGRQ